MLANFIKSLIVISFTLVLCLVGGEILLRVKNSDGANYHIEMWKYSRDLKKASNNETLGHEHVPASEATLQNVQIRINDRGMRGGDITPATDGQRRVMFIGSSATLGWGIEEEETISTLISDKFKSDGINATVMNAGIGNYNAKRYVELFLKKNTDLKPTDIVVNYYLNDAETLETGGGNFFLRNSELAVTLWILSSRLFQDSGKGNLLDHYKSIYSDDYQGFGDMKESLKQLSEYAGENGIRLYLMMMPEVHDIKDYKYYFAHEKVKELAREYGYHYIEPLDELKKVETVQDLWAMPGDPHPNALAHRIFADVLYPELLK